MWQVKLSLGCLTLLIIIGLGLFFAKYLVPIVPLLIGVITFFASKKYRKTVFKKPQDIQDLTEGEVLLEGVVSTKQEELISPYFNEKCIGYLYKKIEYQPTEDGYFEHILANETACLNFSLRTNSGDINVVGKGLDFWQLIKKSYTEHSLKPTVNDIGYEEHYLKNNDKIVLVGNAIKNNQRFEIAKQNNGVFFVTTKNAIEEQKLSFQILKRLFPWMVIIYLVVNYYLFFAPVEVMPKSDVFAVASIFGLPVLFIVFWLIGRNGKDGLSQIFQYLAGVCILTSLLTFPLLILFYMIELEFYRIFYIVISIMSVTAIGLLFNYKKLIEYNSLSEKLTGQKNDFDDVYNSDEELY